MLKIISNRIPRPLLTWEELTPKEREELDWADPDNSDKHFFRYKKHAYALMAFGICFYINGKLRIVDRKYDGRYWEGWYGHTYDKCLVIRITEDRKSVIVGEGHMLEE